MPELPEVETLCRQLRKAAIGKVIRDFTVFDPKIDCPGELAGRKILSVKRRGKAIVLQVNNDAVIVLHLRMTGALLWRQASAPLLPHTRFSISFTEGRLDLIDPRRFATLVYQVGAHVKISAVDPLGKRCADQLISLAPQRRLPVKAFLLDQRIVAGIGNIYACEILHAAAVSPWRATCTLTQNEWSSVASAAQSILSRAIQCRGTTVSDWQDLFGRKGEYQHELAVYDREGKSCLRCGATVARARLQGRGTYFCPSCQL